MRRIPFYVSMVATLSLSVSASSQMIIVCQFCERSPSLGDYSECKSWDLGRPTTWNQSYGRYCYESPVMTGPDGYIEKTCHLEMNCMIYARYEAHGSKLVKIEQRRCGKGALKTVVAQV